MFTDLICFEAPSPVCLSGTVSNLKPSQIVSYEDVKNIPKCHGKLLIDVREPSELVADGKIPFSINIPCKLSAGLINRDSATINFPSSENSRGKFRTKQ
jgi:3-mercaptopyruvate sulfurtransferase SseA